MNSFCFQSVTSAFFLLSDSDTLALPESWASPPLDNKYTISSLGSQAFGLGLEVNHRLSWSLHLTNSPCRFGDLPGTINLWASSSQKAALFLCVPFCLENPNTGANQPSKADKKILLTSILQMTTRPGKVNQLVRLIRVNMRAELHVWPLHLSYGKPQSQLQAVIKDRFRRAALFQNHTTSKVQWVHRNHFRRKLNATQILSTYLWPRYRSIF